MIPCPIISAFLIPFGTTRSAGGLRAWRFFALAAAEAYLTRGGVSVPQATGRGRRNAGGAALPRRISRFERRAAYHHGRRVLGFFNIVLRALCHRSRQPVSSRRMPRRKYPIHAARIRPGSCSAVNAYRLPPDDSTVLENSTALIWLRPSPCGLRRVYLPRSHRADDFSESFVSHKHNRRRLRRFSSRAAHVNIKQGGV